MGCARRMQCGELVHHDCYVGSDGVDVAVLLGPPLRQTAALYQQLNVVVELMTQIL